MSRSDEVGARAAALAEEVSSAVEAGRPAERIEQILLAAMREVTARERERCASLAEQRAAMWERSKLQEPGWPVQGRAEAQERRKEALAIADAIRAGVPLSPTA